MISLRSVLKRLAVDKRFTALSVLTLGGGIGLAVAIFALVHGVLLAPLPYPHPEQLVDPVSFVLAPLFLLGVAVASSLLPAERAAKVNPIVALRRD